MTDSSDNSEYQNKSEEYRKDLLLEMYRQMFNDINRHIVVIWQSVGVLLGAFTLFALVQKQIIPVDIASALLVLIAAWLIAHIYDASYWYNRNLVIIANVERQFLRPEDLREIHYYFGGHRKTSAMLTHLKIQWYFGIGIAALVLAYHFATRVLPLWSWEVWTIGLQRLLPYLVLLASIVFLGLLRGSRIKSYENFIENSPGRDINAQGVRYGSGHPTA